MNNLPQNENAAVAERLVFSRSFNAPLALVFEAFTRQEHLRHWWTPAGCSMKYCTLDLRPGGQFHYCQVLPNGQEMWGRLVYTQIVPPDLLEFIVSFSDKDGNISTHPLMPDWPAEILSTVRFEEKAGITTIQMTSYPINASDRELEIFKKGKPSVHAGTEGTMRQLEAYLHTLQQS